MTVTFEDLWAEFSPVVEGIATESGRKYHQWGADREDFAQELTLWVLDNTDWLASKREEIDDDRQFTKFLARCLRNEIHDYQVDIKAQAGGQDRTTAYWYSVAEVKYLLDQIFDEDAWLNPPQIEGGGGRGGDPALGNNWLATLADVSRAFTKLSSEDQSLLRDFHEYGARNKAMASINGVTEATMSYRHGQACKRLLEELGGPKPKHMRPDDPHDPWRGRHAVTNASARAMQAHYWSGEDE
jgi:DNA-directed RNA polymerase specialized sigma24 family protein